jgi:hypothetical protein
MKRLVARSIGIHLKIIGFFRFYPSENFRKLYRIYSYDSYEVHCVFVIPVPLLSAVDLLFRENLSLGKASENAFLICQLGCFIFKLLPFINNADEMEANIYIYDRVVNFLR